MRQPLTNPAAWVNPAAWAATAAAWLFATVAVHAQAPVVAPDLPSPDGDKPFVFAPADWQIWHQASGSALMEDIEWFSAYTLFWMAIPVSVFVLALIGWVVYRYRKSANPVPSKVTHNTMVEVVWTVVPVLILVAVAVPSFQLLSVYERPKEEVDMTIKTIGYQWYWGYEYQDGPEGSELAFEQRLIGRTDGTATQNERARAELASLGKDDEYYYPNNLRVDNEMVVPQGATVRLLVTAADVIHDWAMPALGAKMDAIPGRLNEFTFTPARRGIYYGQCSELCGRDHAFMPIGLRVVTPEQYAEWRRLAQDDIAAASRYISEAQAAEFVAAREERDGVKRVMTASDDEVAPSLKASVKDDVTAVGDANIDAGTKVAQTTEPASQPVN